MTVCRDDPRLVQFQRRPRFWIYSVSVRSWHRNTERQPRSMQAPPPAMARPRSTDLWIYIRDERSKKTPRHPWGVRWRRGSADRHIPAARPLPYFSEALRDRRRVGVRARVLWDRHYWQSASLGVHRKSRVIPRLAVSVPLAPPKADRSHGQACSDQKFRPSG
jgi:hypothetical protein